MNKKSIEVPRSFLVGSRNIFEPSSAYPLEYKEIVRLRIVVLNQLIDEIIQESEADVGEYCGFRDKLREGQVNLYRTFRTECETELNTILACSSDSLKEKN